MDEFKIWFSTGVEHILDLNGYDHILFVTLLVLTYYFNKWGKLLLLISAFTIGHSISLALSVTNKIYLPQPLTEFFIALSILITAIYHLVYYKTTEQKNANFIIFIVTFFGLIHGLGFSYLLRSMLGREESISLPLLWFNLGLEVGQLIIVAGVLLISIVCAFVFKFPYKLFKLIVVGGIGLIALKMSVERLLELF
ncbi:MAG: HupE/UreJ family protein [Bacteroidia bacterium]|nr:HupE/UreJ family protein [Bacteroidia bacterium]